MYHEKYQHASNLGANVPDVHLPLKPGGDHQQSLNNHFPWKGGSVSSTIIISLLATTRINQNAVVSCLYIRFKIRLVAWEGPPRRWWSSWRCWWRTASSSRWAGTTTPLRPASRWFFLRVRWGGYDIFHQNEIEWQNNTTYKCVKFQKNLDISPVIEIARTKPSSPVCGTQ